MDCRFIQSVLRIKLSFQLFVQVSLNSVVYNQPDVQTAITQQIVAINLGQAACLQLTTVLNYPYELTNGDLVSTPPGKFTSHTISSSIVSCSGTSECRQRWSTCLNLVNGTCDLNGPYQMNFTKECRDSSIACPLSDSEKSLTVDFTLVSENFCAEITIDIGLYGTLQLYDMTFTHEKSAIVVGTRSCFLAVVNSDLNPAPYNASTAAILLEGVQLVSVTVRLENSSDVVELFDSSTPESFDYNTQLEVMNRPQVNQLGFCYNFSDTLLDFFQNNTVVVTKRGFIVGGRAIFTTGATIKVQFSGHVKRAVLAVTEDQSTLSSTNQLDTDSSNNVPDSGSITIMMVPLLLMIISLFF